eukprot:scaffold11.g4075.t1
MSVVAALQAAGLQHLAPALAGLSFKAFRGLLIQARGRPCAASLGDVDDPAYLVDLDADDTDFLTDDLDLDGFTEQAFVPSPAPDSAGPPGAVSAVGGAGMFAGLPDPPKIRVIEVERSDSDVLECDMASSSLCVNEPRQKVDLTKFIERHSFRFDDVFDENVTNDQLYSTAIQPLIATVFKNGKGTCFAYGQTGSGKTYTMQPLPMRAAQDIFRVLALPEYAHLRLHVSCYEIYGGKVFDLLNGRKRLEIREDGKKRVQARARGARAGGARSCVVGLKDFEVGSQDMLQQLMDHSAAARSTGSTGANDESSRSHSIMQFSLRTSVDAPKTVGKLSFIDLAGSERGADTYDNDKQTRLEGAEINKSLLALKECIRALDSDARHIPFRGSKLTEVLRDSFIGKNARTVMIANVSPNSSSCEHTLNTLRYADRVKEIRKPGAAPANGTASTDTELAAVFSRLPMPAHAPVAQTSLPALQPAAPPAAVLNGSAAPAPAPAAAAEPAASRQTTRLPAPPSKPPSRKEGVAAVAAAAAVEAAPPALGGGSKSNVTTWRAARHASPPRPAQAAIPQQQQSLGAGGTLLSPGAARGGAGMRQPAAADAADVEDMLNAVVAAEDDLIASHRQHIEESMAAVREEMNLLGELDGGAGAGEGAGAPRAWGDMEMYAAELSNILAQKQADIAQLQLKVSQFRRLMQQATTRGAGVLNDF